MNILQLTVIAATLFGAVFTCSDRYGRAFCQASVSYCDNSEMQQNCRETCGTCDLTTARPRPTPARAQDVVQPGECFNSYGDRFCSGSKHLCHKTGMKQNCRKECGTCGMVIGTERPGSRPTAAPKPAFDPVEEIRECPEDDLYPDLCANSDIEQCNLKIMQDACPIKCGVCDPFKRK